MYLGLKHSKTNFVLHFAFPNNALNLILSLLIPLQQDYRGDYAEIRLSISLHCDNNISTDNCVLRKLVFMLIWYAFEVQVSFTGQVVYNYCTLCRKHSLN